MGWTARLKALDDRLLGNPTTPTASDYRRATLTGAVGVLAMTAASFAAEAPSLLGSASVLLGVTGMNAVRWRRSSLAERRRQ